MEDMKKSIIKDVLENFFYYEDDLLEWLNDWISDHSLEEIEKDILSLKELAKEYNCDFLYKFVIYEDEGLDNKKYYGVDYKESWEGSPIGTFIKEV